jgi:hypothetical protein
VTHLAIVDLDMAKNSRSGRVFLDRDQLDNQTVAELKAKLEECFVESDDEERMGLIENLIDRHDVLQVVVFPGEQSPPEYHAYLRTPGAPDERLFACVLAPEPIIRQLVERGTGVVFETATFQGMQGDTTPIAMQAAVESWARRVWPGHELPRFEVLPWPIENVHTTAEGQLRAQESPRGAPVKVDRKEEDPSRKAG